MDSSAPLSCPPRVQIPGTCFTQCNDIYLTDTRYYYLLDVFVNFLVWIDNWKWTKFWPSLPKFFQKYSATAEAPFSIKRLNEEKSVLLLLVFCSLIFLKLFTRPCAELNKPLTKFAHNIFNGCCCCWCCCWVFHNNNKFIHFCNIKSCCGRHVKRCLKWPDWTNSQSSRQQILLQK